ncbi:MAG: hypothetical protein PF482_12905 [Desulfobacteraceae bacterium]|jgi:hypothetical protein|nr:hypothetical protein [Desulfobacteraceae bacterium]
MGLVSFFKLPSYSVFNYQPRFYDAEKERQEKRRKQLRIEQGKDIDLPPGSTAEDRIRGKMQYKIPPVKKAKRRSNLRLLGILAVLLLLVYIIMAV